MSGYCDDCGNTMCICKYEKRISQLENQLRGVNPFTGCKCRLYEETLMTNLESQIVKLKESNDYLTKRLADASCLILDNKLTKVIN